MKTLTTHTRILFMALVILATFFLSPIPCLADSHIRDDPPKKGPIEAAAGVVKGVFQAADEGVLQPTAKVANGAFGLTNEILVQPTAKVANGAFGLTNEILVQPTAKVANGAFGFAKKVGKGVIEVGRKVAKPVLKVLTFGIWDC
ncbi:MAG: hypothetical protein KAV87_51020 [Desulfobacteraceae bacterium]|nr:hypothetical protein [Desulfobacteraceae bacterium]